MGKTHQPRIVAVSVPEYWPRPRFVALALQAETIWLADSFQYSRQSFQNRARLRTPTGWQWISIPLRGRQHGRPIVDVDIAPREWRRHHLRSLQHHYGTTPFYPHYADAIRLLLNRPWERLGGLTAATAEWTLRAFGLDLPIERTSTWSDPPDRFAALSRTRDAHRIRISTEVVPGHDLRLDAAVETVWYDDAPRHQNFPGFERQMTALDVLFNYGPEGRDLIRSHSAVS